MDYQNRYPGIDKYAAWLIKRKIKQLIGEVGFTQADWNDLEQELVIDLLDRLPKYNRNRSERKTFIAKIVDNKVKNIITSQKAGIRDYRLSAYSLNESVEDGEGKMAEYIDNLNQDDYFRRTGKYVYPLDELEQLPMDLRKIIGELPPVLQNLCERLQKETVSEISRSTGIPRGTIYESIHKLRILLEEAGLKNYF